MSSAEEPGGTGSEQNLSFEEAFERLGKTVESLESGGLSLESATALYEDGMRLVELCNRLLNTAELRVTRLKSADFEQLSGKGTDAHWDFDGDE